MAVISPPAIDMHAHYLPSSYRAALGRAGIEHPDGMPAVPQWDESSAIALMDEVGIGAALLSISSPGFGFAAVQKRAELASAVNEQYRPARRRRSTSSVSRQRPGASPAVRRSRGMTRALDEPDLDPALLSAGRPEFRDPHEVLERGWLHSRSLNRSSVPAQARSAACGL
jgi:hypothetical protein